MKINYLNQDDWQKYKNIRLTGLQTDPQAFGSNYDREIKFTEEEWKSKINKSDRIFFAMEENDSFISIAGAKKVSDNVWMIVGVYTRAEFRGKGFAEKLVLELMNKCGQKDADTFQLLVNIEQKSAVKMYERLGFKVIKTIKGEIMGDSKLHDEYFMQREV